jgi:hypothetical protein
MWIKKVNIYIIQNEHYILKSNHGIYQINFERLTRNFEEKNESVYIICIGVLDCSCCNSSIYDYVRIKQIEFYANNN